MSHNVTLTRNELIQILQSTYSANDIVDLDVLAAEYAQRQAAVRLELYLENLITALYVVNKSQEDVIVIPVDSYDAQTFAEALVAYVNDSSLHTFLDSSQILVYSNVEEVQDVMLEQGDLDDITSFHPSNVKLAIEVIQEGDSSADATSLFSLLNCTKIRFVV